MNKQLLKKFEKERVRDCRDVFNGIAEMLEVKKNAVIQEAFNESNYAIQSWSEHQADKLGAIRTLNETINLLKVNTDD